MPGTKETLFITFPPRGLSRQEAASYIGVSPSLFDRLVAEGLLPSPKMFHSKKVWDRIALDIAFGNMPDAEGQNPWDS